MSRSRSLALRKDLKDQVRVELNKEDEAHKKSNTDYAEYFGFPCHRNVETISDREKAIIGKIKYS